MIYYISSNDKKPKIKQTLTHKYTMRFQRFTIHFIPDRTSEEGKNISHFFKLNSICCDDFKIADFLRVIQHVIKTSLQMTSTLLLIHLIFDKKFCQWSDFRSIVCARWLVNLKKNVLIFISFDPLYIVQQCQNIFIRSHHPENKTWVIDTYSTWASYQIWLSGSAKFISYF